MEHLEEKKNIRLEQMLESQTNCITLNLNFNFPKPTRVVLEEPRIKCKTIFKPQLGHTKYISIRKEITVSHPLIKYH